ncbi:MAG: DUF2523 domain-containing protein [Endozoicomonadaceae bacterium]|nr:DUF2523 domain-containing protein [Endozoicomonadaceae bacterium]
MKLIGILVWFLDTIGARVLTSLGIGFLSFAAVTTAATSLANSFSSSWSSITPTVLKLISIAGFPGAIGWIIGALLAKLALNSIPKLGKLT